MVDEVIETGVDNLINLLKTEKKISLTEAAKKINVSVDIVQAWVDFLVEEKIIGIEYKFTVPYIYLNNPEISVVEVKKEEENLSMDMFKDEFFRKALKNNMPKEKIPVLWKNHLNNVIDNKKAFFYNECAKRKVDPDLYWMDYKNRVMGQ